MIVADIVVPSFWPPKTPTYRKASWYFYLLHCLQGRFCGIHFLIFILKLLSESNCFISFGINPKF